MWAIALSGTIVLPATIHAGFTKLGDDEIVLREGLVIPPVGRYGRSPVHTDAIEAEIVAGRWKSPQAGDVVKLPDGAERKWEPIKAADDGTFQHAALGGGYVYISVESEAERVMMLHASGHSVVYVNGEPRTGDPYSHGYVHLPVLLREGTNELLFHVGRGRLTAKLVAPKADAQLDLADVTQPDLIIGKAVDADAAVVVINATTDATSGLAIEATCAGGEMRRTPVPSLVPLQTRKIRIHLGGYTPNTEGDTPVELKLVREDGDGWRTVDTATLTLRAVRPDQTHRRTFRSLIDGSVQYYAVVPPKPSDGGSNHAADAAAGTAASESPRTVRFLRRSGQSLAPECSVESRQADGRTVLTSITTRPGTTLTLAAQFDADKQLIDALVAIAQGQNQLAARVAVSDGIARVTRHDGTVSELDCPQGVIVTSAPDWTDAIELVRRYDRARGGRQEFAGLWIHPTEEPKRVTFAVARTGEDTVRRDGESVRLDRFVLELRGGSRYVGWDDQHGNLIRLDPAGRTDQGIVLEGWELARGGDGEKDRDTAGGPALVLTLHGAGVEGIGQANAYLAKPWAYTVAPTNRRPFGFDWEDWGRLDAIEVLDIAQRTLGTDPRRTYLTGHSMGGHGVWQIGAHFPDRFAAIGPSAGWISMSSYAGARRPENPDPIQELMLRAASASDTLAIAKNYSHHGVYVLHGEKDDNVPVAQARMMKGHLEGFHKDFAYHEEPGMGHWWGKEGVPGTACVDWPPMWEFFRRHTIPARGDVRHVEFTTVSPGVSSRSHWVAIEAQLKQLQATTVKISFDPSSRRFTGTTENAARLAFDLGHLPPGKAVHVELDGHKIDDIDWPDAVSDDASPRLWLQRTRDKWQLAPRPPAKFKGPHRYGTFKDAFRNHVMLVYGTRGTQEEKAWALAKARLDAERFWYQGNASVDVMSDWDYWAECASVPLGASRNDEFEDRNVILYGNADTNFAWERLLADSPVQVHRGRLRVGDRDAEANDMACLFVRPRPGSDTATVGVVTGTGIAGMRLTDRLPYFVSGVAYPDCTVLTPAMLTSGPPGVRAAGFFGLDWGVDSGEFVWSD